MCGRFSRIQGKDVIITRFDLQSGVDMPPSYNIAPKASIGIITQDNNLHLSSAVWGLLPYWAKSEVHKPTPINLRSDKIFEMKTSRKLIESGRCIIPASGFFEWRNEKGKKIPYHFQIKEEEIIAFAGLYNTWEKGEKNITSCTIITTDANEVVSEVHSRMPVILNKKDESTWISNNPLERSLVDEMLIPFESSKIIKNRVSERVNNVKNNDITLLEPIDDQPEQLTKGQTTLNDWF
ncbi:MAG: SOS response-associated peptidase [Candidatus Heimdallarchaeota archaeon]|nr:SOS response-associated peptidase [Candidatus Heimdallarchaeota archaeon]